MTCQHTKWTPQVLLALWDPCNRRTRLIYLHKSYVNILILDGGRRRKQCLLFCEINSIKAESIAKGKVIIRVIV
ncbi:hypothetical protein HanRHA438_Chr01g0045181 [Helianthus annuus]|nr:hypothetical protein HanHA89_Chr01g0038731 [Helianthus annuus]KAJ0950055.1 hypothetical protein HanRHA438_Chr01g0045181 [Helianthus annuus]